MYESMQAIYASLADLWENLFYSDASLFYNFFDFGLAVLLNSIFFAICLIPFVLIFRLFDWGVRF